MTKSFVFLFIIGQVLIKTPAFADILVITNKSVPNNILTQREIKQIFLGKKKKWSDGSRIHAVIINKGREHKDLLKKYVHKTPFSFSIFWKRAIVSGTGIPPKSFSNAEDLLKFVQNNKGVIGYIPSNMPYDHVNIIQIKQ